MPLNPVQDVQTFIRESLDGTALGQELEVLSEDVDRRQNLRLEEWFERVALWTQGLCDDARHGGEFCELMNRLPRYMEHGETARRAYDHLVNQLIMGYEAIRRTASEEVNVLSGALGTNEYIVQHPDSFLPHVKDSISVTSYVEHAIATIELNLRQPLRALDETPFRVECEEQYDPLFRCMVYSLSKARDILCDNMIRIGANRHSPNLYSSLQGREPFSGWSAGIEVFHKSITMSLYRGWTWLGLNAVAFGATETCVLDMLPQETRNNLRELLRRPNVYERLPYQNGIEEVLTFLRDFLTIEPEHLPISINRRRFEVTYQEEVYRITERQTRFLSDLLERRGTWVTGAVLRDVPGERIDRVKNTLPPPILALIESHLRNGYRLNLPE